MNSDLSDAIQYLEHFGYCVLRDRMPRQGPLDLAERCLALHGESDKIPHISGSGTYQTLFGMLNYDDRVWQYAFHQDAVAIARHFLGETCRVVEACSKPT